MPPSAIYTQDSSQTACVNIREETKRNTHEKRQILLLDLSPSRFFEGGDQACDIGCLIVQKKIPIAFVG